MVFKGLEKQHFEAESVSIYSKYCPEIVALVEARLLRASAIQVSWSLESGFAYSS